MPFIQYIQKKKSALHVPEFFETPSLATILQLELPNWIMEMQLFRVKTQRRMMMRKRPGSCAKLSTTGANRAAKVECACAVSAMGAKVKGELQ